jgi:ATP-binding cassette subfamily C protein
VAFVGPSGSGKSTLLRLLLGFERPERGAVHYDGRNLAALDVTAVRRQLGVVLQAGRLMPGSLLENIRGGGLLTLDEAWAAARHAGLEEDIRALPMGMHTVIGEGSSTLSGGQRQRLLIARALARQPRILFLDEATSALDNRTQAMVSRSLEQLQCTRVVIAHRLSTVVNADRIHVLTEGRIVQTGTYEELAAQEGLFRDLVRRQVA